MSLLILVVDDEPDVEDAVPAAVPPRSARRALHDGIRAVGGMTRCKQISDAADVTLILILSDINMPGMSGLELLPKARRRGPTCRSS